MVESPLLFHLKPPTTTRVVADLVRHGGVTALDDAQRRADLATYQEVTCRSALNRVSGMPFEWTLNPYRGCTHGCHYCYARRYHQQFELDSDDQFSAVILVKVNLVEVLRRELASPKWNRELVAVGTATDVYQPIEGHYKLTRRALQALAAARTPTGIVTKGPMCVRDIDVMQELSRRSSCTVYVSVPTVDEVAWAKLEPGTAHPLQRLRAVRQLKEAGIDVGVLMNPIVPGITSHPRQLERTVRAIADHGATFVGMNVMFLEGGSRDHFMNFLAREYPHLVDGYQRLYARKHPPQAYRNQVRTTLGLLQAKYDMAPRPTCESGPAPAAEQARFDWK